MRVKFLGITFLIICWFYGSRLRLRRRRFKVHPLEQTEYVDLHKGAERDVDDAHVGRKVEEVDELGRHPEHQAQQQRRYQLTSAPIKQGLINFEVPKAVPVPFK